MQTPRSAHAILGIPHTATADEVRLAYLQLVKKHPPDRDADRFREIHTAYKTLSTPLAQADAIVETWATRPDLQEVISDADVMRPRFQPLVLLALGNREARRMADWHDNEVRETSSTAPHTSSETSSDESGSELIGTCGPRDR